MNLDRSFAWRISAVYAAFIVASLVALIFVLREDPPDRDVPGLRVQKEEESRLAASLAAPLLADRTRPPDLEAPARTRQDPQPLAGQRGRHYLPFRTGGGQQQQGTASWTGQATRFTTSVPTMTSSRPASATWQLPRG